ncbi:hypothetical protein GXP67_36030 [Rhodocytophaga rosea]|uniref:Uncharacterized protein n=1 Tax=Rhodocytophaga rosea TaxID=2704465 RepID=A0A6C0GUG5_9BACT|nr:hypothetical protein [Rhodocytophaga rosea]QHT71696.1 hypothetical protein GXP67_36030 [Rhodocytophaga rosea]
MFQGFGPSQQETSPASVIVEMIYQAANDNSDKFRYPAGKYAQLLLTKRKAEEDDIFIKDFTKQFVIQSVGNAINR